MSHASATVSDILAEAGALKSGHFILSSGLHSARYCQCATLFEFPALAERLAAMMRDQVAACGAKTVLAPALGGVLWGYELARAIGARSLFAERQPGEPFVLRRGFALEPGERVLLAEDVVTTGKSVLELVPLVEEAGAVVAGFAAIADRSSGRFQPAAPFWSLIRLEIETYDPAACPLCRAGSPAVKPGSRITKS